MPDVGVPAADVSLPVLEAGVQDQGAGGLGFWGRRFLACTRPQPCCPHRRAVSAGFPVSPCLTSYHPSRDLPLRAPLKLSTTQRPHFLMPSRRDRGFNVRILGHTLSVQDVLSTPRSCDTAGGAADHTAVPQAQHMFALVLRGRGWPSPARYDPPPLSLCRVGGPLIPAEADSRAPTAPICFAHSLWATRLPAPAAHQLLGASGTLPLVFP